MGEGGLPLDGRSRPVGDGSAVALLPSSWPFCALCACQNRCLHSLSHTTNLRAGEQIRH